MTELEILNSVPVEELVNEVKRRARGSEKSFNKLHSVSADTKTLLSEIKTSVILSATIDRQKAIYGINGGDDRKEIIELPVGSRIREDAGSVVALFEATKIANNGDGTSTLITENFGTKNRLCSKERFRDQPVGAFCSGFLVAPDVVATAGHCVDEDSLTNTRFVFGFRMRDAQNARTVIKNSEMYNGTELIDRKLDARGTDWALVKLDRKVTNHQVLSIRRSGKIDNVQAVHVIGHPVGLPAKFADGAKVRTNTNSAFFVANLDTYGGNSGSPVFNSDTHEVEGILVRGETDFVAKGNCNVSLVCPDTGCRGEECTRTTEFSHLL